MAPRPNLIQSVTRRILPSGTHTDSRHTMRLAPYAFAALSGVMLTLSFPGWNLDVLAWFALMPLVYGILQHPGHAFRMGFVTGLAFFGPTLFWLRHVTMTGWLLLGMYLALYVAVWAWGLARFRRIAPENSGGHHLRLAVFAAASWTALEWIRGRFLSGFPWNELGVCQFRNLSIIQISEITGVAGISFLIVFFNVAFFCGLRRMVLERFSMARWRYEITVSLLMLVCVMIWGMRAYMWQSGLTASETIRVGLIQPNVPQTLKWVEDADRKAREDLRQLTLEAARLNPDFIVWPETALTTGPSYDAASSDFLDEIVAKTKTRLIIGTVERDPFSPRYFNTALLISPDSGYAPPYHKRHLVPFGEFVPLADAFPFLRRLTPIGVDFGRGKGAQLLQDSQRDVRIGMLICFEDVFSARARESVHAGANLLINITNDGWFKESDEQMQHAANAVFRAVENRVPLVRCSNNGYTCVIDPSGRISASLEDAQSNIYIRGMKIAEVKLYDRPPAFFTQRGDVFAMLCLTLAGLAWAAWAIQAAGAFRHPLPSR